MPKPKSNTIASDNQLSLWQPATEETSPFDRIRHVDENGKDYWSARELAASLEYSDWRNFKKVIAKARVALKNVGAAPSDHIVGFSNMIETGKGAQREVSDFKLTRLACYHVANEADASKPVVAAAKNYFITQARKQEIAAERKLLKHNQNVTAYQLHGKAQDWAGLRVDSSETEKYQNATAHQTHETNHPNYGALANAKTKTLFAMARQQIVGYLGLLPRDEPDYRDFLGKYALEAIVLVNKASSREMVKLGRGLTDDEQLAIIQGVAERVAKVMREVCELASVDFISGAPLDDNGRALISRNVRLIGASS